MPPCRILFTPWRFRGLLTVTPPARRKAAPDAATTVEIAMVPVPSGLVSAGLSMRIAPWLMFTCPDQPVLLALTTSVPRSFFVRLAVAPAPAFKSNAASSCSVAPLATSMTRVLAVPANRMTGLPEKLAEARKVAAPVAGASETTAPPSAPTEDTESTPCSTTIGAPITLPAPERTKAPGPLLVKPEGAVRLPENSRPWVTFERDAVRT